MNIFTQQASTFRLREKGCKDIYQHKSEQINWTRYYGAAFCFFPRDWLLWAIQVNKEVVRLFFFLGIVRILLTESSVALNVTVLYSPKLLSAGSLRLGELLFAILDSLMLRDFGLTLVDSLGFGVSKALLRWQSLTSIKINIADEVRPSMKKM